MGMDYIRKAYGVPAKRGGRVEYTGAGERQLGTITGANGGHLRIRLDGRKLSTPFHPTWRLRYITSEPSFACAEVILTPVEARPHGANEDALAALNQIGLKP